MGKTPYNWPFDSTANYVYDPTKIDVMHSEARVASIGPSLGPTYGHWHLNETHGTDSTKASLIDFNSDYIWNGGIKVRDYSGNNYDATTRTYFTTDDENIELTFAPGGYVDCVGGDRRKTVLGATTGDTGLLLDFNNTPRKWVVKPDDWTDDFLPEEDVSVVGGTGSGHKLYGAPKAPQIKDTIFEDGILNKAIEGIAVIPSSTVANFDQTNAFSLEVWAKTSVWHEHQTLLGKYIYITSERYEGYLLQARGGATINDPHGNIRFYFGSRNREKPFDGYILVDTTKVDIMDGEWHHVVLTYDGQYNIRDDGQDYKHLGIHIYVDGTTVDIIHKKDPELRPWVHNHLLQKDGVCKTQWPFTIGAYRDIGLDTAPKKPWRGQIDEVVIWDRELEAWEVKQRYNDGAGTETVGTYETSNPAIYPRLAFTYLFPLSEFFERSTKPVGAEIKYQLSRNDGTTWEWYTGGSWVVSDETYDQANTRDELRVGLNDLHSGPPYLDGALKFRAHLHSNGGVPCELDNVYAEYKTPKTGVQGRPGQKGPTGNRIKRIG